MIATICILVLTFIIAVSVGYIGYLAFGASTKGIILYNLPNENPWAIAAKCAYVLTVCGSFVLLIQPIFYIMESSKWYGKVFHGKDEDKSKKEEEEEVMGAANLSNLDGASKSAKDKDDAGSVSSDDRGSLSCGMWFFFAFLRILIIFTIAGLSFLIPNIHILLTLAGSILGTIVNIYLPVIFYNRAYNYTEKNQKLERSGGKKGDDPEKEKLMGEDAAAEEEKEPELNQGDMRIGIKIGNWIVLVFGTIIGIVGLTYCIIEIKDGEAKADEA
jgi:amino acid permease